MKSSYMISDLILKKHNYSQSLSNAFIQLYSWVYIPLDIAIYVSLACWRARKGHMDKPLAMGRVNRSRVEATIDQFHTKKLHHLIIIWAQHFIFLQPFNPHTNGHSLINFNKDKSSFNTGTAQEIGPIILNKTCYDIQQINTLLNIFSLLE